MQNPAIGSRGFASHLVPSTSLGVGIQINLLLPDLALGLALQLLSLPLELLARIARRPPDGVANAALHLVDKPFALILDTVSIQIVSHWSISLVIRAARASTPEATPIAARSKGEAKAKHMPFTNVHLSKGALRRYIS